MAVNPFYTARIIVSAPAPAETSLGQRIYHWLPTKIDRRIVVAAWLSFIFETVIIATGGAVRLTGSGLGCPTWPLCTADSLTPTAEMGVHGIIEFGNRLMTGVVGIVAVVVVVLLIRLRKERRELWVLSLIVLGGVVAQAVVGGITVLTGLNPLIVGFHYLASLLLVCVCAAFLVRMRQSVGPRELVVAKPYLILTHITSLVLAVVVLIGILTTGSGPHSGDDNVVRQGVDAATLAHWHALPGYILLALILGLIGAAVIRNYPTRNWLLVTLAVLVVQIVVCVYQARNGLPAVAVGVHMVLAALTSAAFVVVILRLKRPIA